MSLFSWVNLQEKKLEIGLFLADLVMIQISFLVAVAALYSFSPTPAGFSRTLGYFLGRPNLVLTLYWVALLFVSRYFRSMFTLSLYGEILRVLNVISLGVLILLFAMIDADDPNSFFSPSKIKIFFYWLTLILTLSFNRLLFHRRLRGKGDVEESAASMTLVQKKLILIFVDLFLIVLSYYLSYFIRLEGGISEEYLFALKASLPVVIIVRFSMFLYFKLYSGYYRYASVNDLTQILKAVTAGSVVIAIPIYVFGYGIIPRSIPIIDWLLMVVLLGGSRFLLRLSREVVGDFWHPGKRTFIIGAGSAAEMILREMRKSPLGFKPVGLIDDNLSKQGLRLHGMPVLGGADDLAKLALKHKVTDVIIAIPSATGAQMRRLVEACRRAALNFKTLPPLKEIMNGQVYLNQVRSLKVEDLLGREPVVHDTRRLARFIQDKHVLVTGGGGSIGSEICRQVMRFQPRKLTIIDRAENRLYETSRELQEKESQIVIQIHVADIDNDEKMSMIFAADPPDVVFHAAAYKQVPLMEQFPEEAVKNNILGTQKMARLADRHGVASFVLISTDKAVRPSSVMGATKRVAEILVQGIAQKSPCSFITVRFGNVLGSDGSVVPIFRRQIEKGGPVTVTHPEVTRYFMTIAEAALLVMQAATVGNSGEILVLNMGEPVKIVDLARAMITLSGATPDGDIQIKFTGLREGEKLTEELFVEEEGLKTSAHEKILIARSGEYDWGRIANELRRLETAAAACDRDAIKALLREIIPDYQPTAAGVDH